MMDDLALSDETLIETLYMAGADARYWPDVLKETLRAFEAQYAAVYLALGLGKDRFELVYHQDMPGDGFFSAGDGDPGDIADARRQAELGVTSHASHRWIHVVVSDTGRLALVLRRQPALPAFSELTAEQLQRLTPFFGRVLKAAGDGRGRMTANSHLEALNAMAMGCLVFSEDDRLVFANVAAKAVAALDIGIQIVDERLRFTDKRAQATLDAALLTFSQTERRTQRPVIEIVVRPPSAAPVLLIVVPIGAEPGNPYLASGRLKTAVYIVRPGITDGPGTGALRLGRLYGLTVAEAEITLQLLLGKTAKTIAADRGVSLHTVRG